MTDRRSARSWLLVLSGALAGCAGLDRSGPVPAPVSEYGELLSRGITLLHEREHSRALEAFDAAATAWPEGSEAFRRRGEALFRMDRYEEAVAAYARALGAAAQPGEVLPGYWSALLQAKPESPVLRQEITAEILDLTRSRPDDIETWNSAYLGYYYLESKEQRREALARFAALAETPEERETAAGYFGYEMMTAGEPAQVEALARRYLLYLAEPDPPESIFALLIRLLDQRIEDDRAFLRELDALLERFPDSISVRLAVAKGLVKRDLDPSGALDLLERNLQILPRSEQAQIDSCWAIELCPELRLEAQHFYYLGVLRQRLGDAPGAAEAFEESIRLGLRDGSAQAHLGRLAANQGDEDEAIALLGLAFELGDQDQETGELLSRLLREHRGFDGPPQEFFARQASGPRFWDVTTEAGLRNTDAQRVAWGDYDNDGFDDLLLDGWRLFRNDRAGAFTEVTEAVGLKAYAGARGGLWGDVDNDGLLDLYSFRHGRNRLARNLGSGGFADASRMLPKDQAAPTEAAAWGDMDNDGWLDLYVANYERPRIERGLCVADRLLRNIQGKSFTDETQAREIRSDEPMCGRGVVWGDPDGDGDQDILVSNYRLDPNFLWVNEGTTAFRDNAKEAGVRGTNVQGYYGHTIGSVFGDVNGNAVPDLSSSNLAHPRAIEYSDTSRLLLGAGKRSAPAFVDASEGSGLGFDETNADPSFADLDNDGNIDLYVTSIYRGRDSHLYLNDGQGRFRDASWISGTRVRNGWGHAFSDFDNDGDQDLLVASDDGVRLFRNDTRGGHWLQVRIEDPACNRFGVGSRIEIRYQGKTQIREVTAGRGTGSQDSLTQHFGLGDYQGSVRLLVQNLCGSKHQETLQTVDRIFVVRFPGSG